MVEGERREGGRTEMRRGEGWRDGRRETRVPAYTVTSNFQGAILPTHHFHWSTVLYSFAFCSIFSCFPTCITTIVSVCMHRSVSPFSICIHSIHHCIVYLIVSLFTHLPFLLTLLPSPFSFDSLPQFVPFSSSPLIASSPFNLSS